MMNPERLARAISEVFTRDGWHQAHGWDPRQVAETLAAHGIERFCFFSYAHEPGIARALPEPAARKILYENAARFLSL